MVPTSVSEKKIIWGKGKEVKEKDRGEKEIYF
jgi:hypothetical protein